MKHYINQKNTIYKSHAFFIIFCILLFISVFSVFSNIGRNTYIYNKDVFLQDKPTWNSPEVPVYVAQAAANNPPQVLNLRIVEPGTNGRQFGPGRPYTGDKLEARYDFSDPDGDSETNDTIIKWYRNGSLVATEYGRILSQVVRKGERWYFSITPSDGKSFGETKISDEVLVLNAPPTIRYARILPLSPTAKDDLTADYEYSDPENDPQGNHEIRWYKNGVIQIAYNDRKIIPAFEGYNRVKTKGEKWHFTIKPQDSDGAFGNQIDSASVTVINQKPVVKIDSISGPLDEDGDYTGDITVRFSLVDEDGDRCRLSAYYQGGSMGNTAKIAAHIKEATNPSVEKHVINNVEPGTGLILTWTSTSNEPAFKADNYRIGIKPNDGSEDGIDGLYGPFSLDNNKEPSVSDVAISPPSPFSSDELVATYKFFDPDGDKESGSEIKWYKNDQEQVSLRNKDKVPPTATVRGENWYFTVVPKDGKEAGQLKRSNTVKINNAPPESSIVKIEPENPTPYDNLKAIFKFTDADNDPIVSYQIRWYKQQGANESLQDKYNNKDTIPADDKVTAKGQVWYFTVQATDGITPSKVLSSNRVSISNMIPIIRSLTVPAEAFRDVPIRFDLVDADGDKCSLRVEYQGGLASNWTVATIKEPVVGVSPGFITLTWESAKDQIIQNPAKFQIRVTPNDGTTSGETVESNFFTLDNNIPPEASNLEILPAKPTSSDNLIASYVYNDPDGGKETGSEIIWHKDGEPTVNKGKILLSSATAKGQSWHFTVRPRDESRYGEMKASNPVVILNSPPVASNIIVKPAVPKSGDNLSVQYDYRDLDGDRESGTELEWYKNGVSAFKKTVAIEQDKVMPYGIAKDEKWYVVVRPRDGEDFGQPVSSPVISIDNAAPEIRDIKISGDSGDITITYTLIDADKDPCDLDVHYQGGLVKTTWTPAQIKESTRKVSPGVGLKLTWMSKSNEPGQKAKDYVIRIIPNDGKTSGIIGVSDVFEVNNNSLPTAINLKIVPETPITSDDLNVSYGFSDLDNDKEGKPEIRWYKNGLLESSYNDMNPLPSSATRKGDRWYYTIRVYDGKDYGKVQLSPQVTIINAPPTASNVRLTPEQPQINEQITASYIYNDADGDVEKNTEIRWYRNNVLMQVYNNSKFVPGNATKAGEEWYFTVKPGDGVDFGIPVPSNKVFISNLPPLASSLAILPVNPLTTDDLIASYVYTDPEGDPESGSKIIWYKNSVAQTKYNDKSVVTSDATAKNQVWYFTVQPRDGKQFGEIKQSPSVIIKNTPPRVDNLKISPPYPVAKDDLVISYDFTDVDGDVEMRSEIIWYRNGVPMRSFDGLKRLPNKETLNGETWYFTVRPYDGTDYGALATSPSVEIGSPIPRANNLYITPRTPFTTDDLSVNYDYVDPNGIPESGSQITWFKDGVAQKEYANRRILPSDATAKGEQWHFSVRPKNGSLFGAEQYSVPVTIINSAPKLKAVAIKPNNPTTDDKLEVDYIFDDPDGDKESRNEIRWFKDGVLQSAFNNMTSIPADATNRYEKWNFTIRTSDGSEFSDLFTSATAIIGNGKPSVDNIKISPVNPLTTDDLVLTYIYSDTEKDPESGTEIKWSKNNISQPNYDNQKTIPASATQRDDKWNCVIRPKDGIDFGKSFQSPTVTIGNTPPTALDILPLSGQVLRGASVIITAQGIDPDSVDAGAALKSIIAYRFPGDNWTELVTQYVEVPTPRWQAVFTPDVKFRLGSYDFRVRFIDTAKSESEWKVKEKLVVVANNPPVIEPSADNLRVKEDTATQFDLRVYGNDLEDGKNLLWDIDPASVNRSLMQATITANRFLEIKPVDDKNGSDDITLTLTDTDGAVTIKSDVTIIIEPVNDSPTMPTSVRITPALPKTTDNLVCEVSGSIDPDGDVVVYRYQWYKNNEIQTGLRSSNVPYARTLKGEIWKCEVIPSDGVSDGPMRFAETTITNSSPEISIKDVIGNTKEIKLVFDLKDADDDSCKLEVEYQVKGEGWKTATVKESIASVKPGLGLTLTWQSDKDKGGIATDTCKLRLKADDGSAATIPLESRTFPLDNKSPQFTIKAIPNPIHPHFVDITIVSDEKLLESPELSAVLSSEETVTLSVKSSGDLVWVSKLTLEDGFFGVVKFLVKGTDISGNKGESEISEMLKVPLSLPRPSETQLFQNYPNPADREDTRIPYQLKESSIVIIEIYSTTGELVRTLNLGYKVAGFYKDPDKAAIWNIKDNYGNAVASGVYFCYFKAGSFKAVKKIVVRR